MRINLSYGRRSWTGPLFACLAGWVSAGCGASDTNTPPKSDFYRFTSATEARNLLGNADDFTQSLSLLDRQLRMKRSTEPTPEEYLAFCQAQAETWTAEEISLWGEILDWVAVGLAELNGIVLAKPIGIVKTSGLEEFNAGYTRGNAIFLPRALVEAGPQLTQVEMIDFMAHELFHVISRTQPELRDALYALAGFVPFPAVAPPSEIQARSITNPDALTYQHSLNVQVTDIGARSGVPILVTQKSIADLLAMSDPLHGFKLSLLAIDRNTGGWATDANQAPELWDASKSDYPTKARINTNYIIHPEEILADNFALLLLRRTPGWVDVPQPKVLDSLASLLSGQH